MPPTVVIVYRKGVLQRVVTNIGDNVDVTVLEESLVSQHLSLDSAPISFSAHFDPELDAKLTANTPATELGKLESA